MFYFPQYTMAIAIMAAPGAESAGLRDRNVQLNDSGICLYSKNTRILSESSLVQSGAINKKNFFLKTWDPEEETPEQIKQRIVQNAEKQVAQNKERFQELLYGWTNENIEMQLI